LTANRVVLTSGKSQFRLQGRVSEIFTRQIVGKLDYTGTASLPILNYFFPNETFAGRPSLTGTLEFSSARLRLTAQVKSDSIGFDRWNATNLRGITTIAIRKKLCRFERMSTGIFGGSAGGTITVESLPGTPRVQLNLTYADIDGVSMTGEFPWIPNTVWNRKFPGSFKGGLKAGLNDLMSAGMQHFPL
jgi:hypothetical protein